MRVPQLQQPARAVLSAIVRPAPLFRLPLRIRLEGAVDGSALVSGRRYASVKAQGQYRVKPKRTHPKKLGAKRIGDQFVIPGNIIYKQRGTLWFPGDNAYMGRDHTIHAAISGYVKYYRDPARHPDRKYIGVVHTKTDSLPYPLHAERKRRLNMELVPRKAAPPDEPAVSASGIPTAVVRAVDSAKRVNGLRQPDKVLKLRKDYSYREDNWAIGRLVDTKVSRLKKSRRAALRRRRWVREQMIAGEKRAAERRKELGEGQNTGAKMSAGGGKGKGKKEKSKKRVKASAKK